MKFSQILGIILGSNLLTMIIFLSYLTNNANSAFSFEQVTLQKLELLVKKFQNNSSGHDDLSISIYKEILGFVG